MSQAPLLVYLHGFLSSPQSEKAQETVQWVHQHRPDIEILVPKLADRPSQAVPQLEALFNDIAVRKPALIGSSMGGLYSAWLSAVHGLRAVLVNPGVFLEERLKGYIGENKNYYTDETFTVTVDDLEQLRQLSVFEPDQSQLKLLLQTEDETLDYRHALQRYPNALTTVEEGGNHRFEDYDNHLPDIIKFLHL